MAERGNVANGRFGLFEVTWVGCLTRTLILQTNLPKLDSVYDIPPHMRPAQVLRGLDAHIIPISWRQFPVVTFMFFPPVTHSGQPLFTR